MTMSRHFLTAGLTFALLATISFSQTCKDHVFPNGNTYESCIDHPVLNTFLHWNYSSTTGIANIAFRHKATTKSQWIAWAINPLGGAMIGSQALVAYLNSDGTVHAYTSSVESVLTHLAEGPLIFPVPSLSGSYVDGELTIFGKLELASSVVSSATQVWQVGGLTPNGVPGGHPQVGDNLRSVTRLNFVNNAVSSSAGSTVKIQSVRGMLASLGMLLPLGAMVAQFV